MGSVYFVLIDTKNTFELKKNISPVTQESADSAVKPFLYCTPSEAYEAMIDKLEDIELAALVDERADSDEIEMRLNDL